MIPLVDYRPSHYGGRQPIVPLLCQGAELPVQLAHRDALGVEYLVLHHLNAVVHARVASLSGV